MKSTKKTNRKKTNRILLGIVLLLVAAILFLIPTINGLLIKQSSTGVTITELDANKLKENLSSEASFDFSKVKNISTTSTWSSINGYNKDNIIGQIVIPSVDINLTLFKGVDEVNLYAGVGTMKADQVMGERNFTIAGHHAAGDGVLFNTLTDISENDVVRLTDKDKIYVYRIKETKTTDPYAFYMLEDSRTNEFDGKPIITLMTCYQKSEYRFFAVGVLEETIPYNEDAMVARD